jgi:4-hydroxy-tetrahydrodipicolinate reductase
VPKRIGKNINIALTGASGRMGLAIQELSAAQTFTVTQRIQRSADWRKIKTIDLVIDFSSPEGFREALQWCVQHKVRLLSGTTGLSSSDHKALKQAAKRIPVLYSANMSLGIAVLTRLLEGLAQIKDWDFQIEEVHHRAKKDSPSGTALSLQHKLVQVLGRELPSPLAVRGGGVPGIHQIWAFGPDESLTLQHTAFNRKVFAQGALSGARWLFDKKEPGLYDLSDLYLKP